MNRSMNRRATLTAATLFLGLGAVAMSACGPTASGSSSLGTAGTRATGSPGTGTGVTSAPVLPATGSASGAPHASGSAGHSGSTGGKPGGGGGSNPINPAHAVVYTIHFVTPSTAPTDTTPVFVHGSVSLQCVPDPNDTVYIPGQGNVAIYHPVLAWETKNATNMALSVDNPDLVGAYDTYSWHGTAQLGDGCYKNNKRHQLDLYAIGSDNKPGEHIVITEAPGLLDYPTPPPFSGGTPSPAPTH